MALTQYRSSLQTKLSNFSKKAARIVTKKSKKEACNFKAIQVMFNALKTEYDKWFFQLVDIFQGVEESIANIESFQWELKDEYAELQTLEEKYKWGMIGSGALALVGLPLTAYSLAIVLGTGSLHY